MSAPATGWRMLPVEPTPEMLLTLRHNDSVRESEQAYAALLAAAPPPTDWNEEAVERAAKAIHEVSGMRLVAWGDLSGHMLSDFRSMARAALAAAPSPQVESGWPVFRAYVGELKATNGTTFVVTVVRDDFDLSRDLPTLSNGLMTVREFTIREHAQHEVDEWNELFQRRRFALPPVADTGGQEAVAWQYRELRYPERGWFMFPDHKTYERYTRDCAHLCEFRALYAAPPPSPGSAAMGDALRVAALALVERMNHIHHDVRYLGVWQCAQNHIGPYTGPKYENELRALEDALHGAEQPPTPEGEARDAKVRELVEALRTINELHPLGDAVYEVREAIDWQAEPFDGESWDHPRVRRYSDAVEAMDAAIAALSGETSND